jgi:predicted ester cyclase
VSPTLSIPPTGKQIKMSGCSVYHWRDNRIFEQWEYSDMLGLLQQLGMIPAMA